MADGFLPSDEALLRSDRMTRPLGYTESLFAALHEASGSRVIRLAVYMRGAPDAATVAAAMEHLEARHPMLRAALVADRGGYRFVVSPQSMPAFEIRRARDGHSVDSVITEGDALTFPAGDRLYRVVFVLDPDRGRSALVWFSHHAISDGLAVDMISTELCALIEALAAGRAVEPAAISFLNADCPILTLSYTDPLLPDAAADAAADRIATALGEPDAMITRSFDAVFAEVMAKGRFPAPAVAGRAIPALA